MEYLEYDDFRPSVQSLYRKGGKFQKAAEKVLAMRGRAFGNCNLEEVFTAALTNYGENRIPHSRKYDLSGFSRLVTMVNNNICMFLFAGSHDDVDCWLDKNRGVDFISKRQGGATVVEPVFLSSKAANDQIIKTGVDLGAPESLLELISGRYAEQLLDGCPVELVAVLKQVGPMVTDDELLGISSSILDHRKSTAVLDVLLKLREGDSNGAKNRIALYLGEVKQLADLSSEEKAEIQSGERVIKVSDVDPHLFEHFVKTASYQKWMLYLHPSQREYVDGDYPGAVRLSGVSGSGKTCVLIHRALRLAQKYPDQPILVLTLNAALATLINSLIDSSRGDLRPRNLHVSSFWEVCRSKAIEFDPQKAKIYTQSTVATNPYAVSEHIDDLWSEFYNCDNNVSDAELMYPLHRSLLVRGIFPKDYIKQEFDYVRSAFSPAERKKYLDMERKGRSVPLDKGFRTQVIDGLSAWERQMNFVGAIDSIAIATSLYQFLGKIEPEYRCILVDEVQDFGSVELAIIRKMVAEDENDLFLCGDAAQSVYTKYQDYEAAQINVRGGRSMRLSQNYRNSRQILAAAHDVLSRNFDRRSKGVVDLEILPPEFANFSSSAPNLLRADSLKDELAYALSHASEVISENPHRKVCIAIAGYHQRGVEDVGSFLSIPVLNGDINIIEGKVVLSDLEQTKGFEFDTMIILNAHSNILPHPDLPPEESFRDLSKFYVAMTRAKTELIVSYHNTVTDFIGTNQEHFATGNWEGYAVRKIVDGWDFWVLPSASVSEKKISKNWDMTGKEFIRTPEAVGLPINAQEKLLERVTGKLAFEGRQKKQKTWKSIGEFLNDMRNPLKRTFIHLSDEAWHAISTHFGRPSGLEVKLAEKTSVLVAP